MSNIDHRPQTVLTDWLTRFGFDKHRTTGENHKSLVYALLSLHDEHGRHDRWCNIGAHEAPPNALAEGAKELMSMFTEYSEKEIEGDGVPLLKALLIVSHGEGQIMVGDPETGDVASSLAELEDDLRNLIEQHEEKEILDRLEAGRVPVRIVSVITAEGLANDVSMFYPDKPEPVVETNEQWTMDEEGTIPENNGPIESALYSMMSFMTLIRNAIADSKDPTNMSDLFVTATAHADGPFGQAGLATLLKMAAFGVETGQLSFGDSEDD